jgi:uncharacterized Fe-S cluster protein YjdI/CDGSH-type Zn-finger protein
MKPVQTYTAPGITVTFDPRICAHSAVCLRGLPAVFDVNRKDWIDPGAASAAEIAAAIDRCPSGALKYTLETPTPAGAAAPAAQAAPATAIRLGLNGPLLVQGEFDLIDENGVAIPHTGRVALCRCGGSRKQPLCDGTHKTNGFRSQREPAS